MYKFDDLELIEGTLNGEHTTFCRSEVVDGAPDGWYLYYDYRFMLPDGYSVAITIYQLTPISNSISDTYAFDIRIGYKNFRFRSDLQRAKKQIQLAEEEAGIEHGSITKLLCRLNPWMANACGCQKEANREYMYITD